MVGSQVVWVAIQVMGVQLFCFRAHKHGDFVGSKVFPAVARAPGHSCCGSLRTKYWWLK